MPLEVTFPDGSVQQFEDGTHPDVIRSAWRGPAPAVPAPEPASEPWPTDPVGYAARGATELLKGLVPGAASSVTSLVDATGAIADFIRRRAGMEPGPLRGIARDWQQTAEGWFPAHPEANLTRAVGEGIGQVGETVLEAWATGGGSLLPKAESLGARLLAGKQAAKAAGHYAAVRMAPAEFSDAYQRALDLGQDPDLAFAKSLGYATVAAMLEDRLGAGRLVRKLVSPEIASKVGSTTVGRFVRDALNNVASNALEEGSQRLAQDLIVEGRPTTGIGSEALVGGIVGALVGAPGSVRTAVQRASPEQRAYIAEQIAKETDPARKAALEEYQGRLADIPDAKPRKLSFEDIAAKEFGTGVEFIPEAKPVPVYRGPALELTATTPFGAPVGEVQPVAGSYAMPGAGGLTVNVTPERVDVAGATPEMLPRIAGALVQQNLVKPVVEAGSLTDDLKAEVAKVQAAPRFQVDAEVQGDKLRVYLPAIRNRQHLKEILREERAHTRIATPEGQAALAEFMRTSPLSPAQYQKLIDDGYAARPGEADHEHKARLTDEFIAKLNRDPKWKQWSQTAVAWVKKTFGLSLTTEQAGRLVLRSLRNVGPVQQRESMSPAEKERLEEPYRKANQKAVNEYLARGETEAARYAAYQYEKEKVLRDIRRDKRKTPIAGEKIEPLNSVREQQRESMSSWDAVAPYLTPDETPKSQASRDKIVGLVSILPPAEEFAAAAQAGAAKRGWYRNSAKALVDVFQGDSPRFAALLAALSPQTSVEQNLLSALRSWVLWTEAGRPQDRAAIVDVLTRGTQAESVLPAWINNSVQALTDPSPETIVLSGPKVSSFAANLRGVTNEVANDTWMANFSLVRQKMFAGDKTGGKGPGYKSMNAVVRRAAAVLTERTGEVWTPAEVQETVWSWTKALVELSEATGVPPSELVARGSLSDSQIAALPDFSKSLLYEPYRSILENASLRTPEASSESSVATNAAPVKEAGSGDASLARAAQRLDRLIEFRKERAALKADLKLAESRPGKTNDAKALALTRRLAALDSSLQGVRESISTSSDKRGPYQTGPVWHGGSFSLKEGDSVFSGWTHFGTKAAAEERVGGSGVVDNLLRSIRVDEVDGKWMFSVDGVDDDTEYATREEAQRAAEREAMQAAEYAEPQGTFTPVYLRGPFVRLPDLGTWDLWDIVRNLPKDAALSASEKETLGELTRSGKQGDDFRYLASRIKAKGFNGIEYRNLVEDKGSTSYIILEPTDVKSVDAKKFDPTSEDVRESISPEVDSPKWKSTSGKSPGGIVTETNWTTRYKNLILTVTNYPGTKTLQWSIEREGSSWRNSGTEDRYEYTVTSLKEKVLEDAKEIHAKFLEAEANDLRESISPEALIEKAQNDFPTAPRFRLGTETKFQGDHITLAPELASRPQWEQQNEIRAAVMEAGVNLLPTKALSEDLYYRLNRAEPARMSAAARALGVDVGTPEGRQVAAASVLMQHVHDARLSGRIGSWIPSTFKPDFGLMDGGSLSSVARLASTLGLSLLGNRGARGLLAARQVLQGIVEAAKQTEAMPSAGVDQAQVAADLARHDIRTYQPWLDFLRGQAGELEAHSYERQRLRTLAGTLNDIASAGRARVLGAPEVGFIDTPEGPAPVSLDPASPNFPDEMEAVGRALTEEELGYHAEYLAELAARRAVQLLDAIDGLSSTIAYLQRNEARADLTEAQAELGTLNEALNELGEAARTRAIEIRASDAALPHADAARRTLADPALLDIAARIDQHAGRTLRPESALTPQELSAMEVAAAVSANQAWVFRDRVRREAQEFRDKTYLPGMSKLRARLLARLKTEGELTIAMHEVMAAAEGEAGQAGTLTGRAAAEALRDRDTAIIRFAEALARSAPDTEVGALRTSLLAGGLDLVPGTVQAAAREAGISAEAVERILGLLRSSPEFSNAIVRLHDVANEQATRATISAIEQIEEALRAQAQAEAQAEVGDRAEGREEARQAREQVRAIATAHLRALNSSARAVRRDVHDLQSQIAELEVQREHHDLLSDVADNAVTELPNIRRMVYEFQDGIKLDAFGSQPEVTIRPGQVYDAALIGRLSEWIRNAREQLDAVDPQTRRGLLVALGDENNPSLVGALVDLNATPETIAKTLAPSYPIDWLSRKGFFRTKEVLSRLVSGIWSSRILATERNWVDIQRKVDLLQAREGAHRHKLMLQAFKSMDLDPRTIGGQMKFRAVYNEFANELRQHESGVEAGQKVWSSGLEGRVLTPELITLLRNDRRVGRLGQAEAEKLPYGGVRENYPGRQVVRKSGETGDVGLARLVDAAEGGPVDLLAKQYESAPKSNGQVTDRSGIDAWWASPAARDALRSHVRSASRTDMSTTRTPSMRAAEQQLANAISSGRVALASLRTVDDWAGAIQSFLPDTVDASTELRSELDQYGAIAVSRRPTPDGGPLQSTFAGRGEGDQTEFTSAAAQLAFPPSWYNYGAVDGLRSMLGRVADPAQVEYLAALKDAAADLNARAGRIETALQSEPAVKTQQLEEMAPIIRWHTTGLFTGQSVTDARAEAAKTKMQVRASILMQEYDRTLRPVTDPIGRINRLLSNIFPFLLLRLTAWASNVFGGPIALQPVYSRFWNTPMGTAMSLGTMGLSAGSMVYNIGRDLGEYAGVVPHSVYQTFLDSEGVGSNFDRQASGEQEAFATGTLPRSRVQRGLDTVKGAADKASEYVGVRRGDRDLNLLMARNVGPAILRRLRTLAASPDVPLSPGVREWLSKFGNPEEVLSLVRDMNPARYYESKLGRRMVYALIEEANASTKVNRPNPNSLLALMGWTTHMLQLLADQTRVTPDASRAEKAKKVAVNTLLGAVAMSAAYYVQIIGRRAMNETASNSASNLATLLSGIPKDVEDPDLLEKLWSLLTELNGAIRSHVWGLGAVEDVVRAPIEALGRASVPAATLTPLHPDFWARDWQDVAGDLALSAPKGIGLNSVQLPALGIAEQVLTAGAQAARGVKTIASNPTSAAQRAGGLEDLSTAGRNALNLLGLVGATVSELAFPGGNAGRASRSQIVDAANRIGVRVEPGFQSGGWLNPTPVRKGLLAAGRELVEATTPEQAAAAENKISALTQYVAERAEKRALDKGDDAATAKQAGVDAVKRVLPDLNPYRHAIGRPLTEKELADLRSKVGDRTEVSRDEQAAQAVTRAASRKYKFPVSRGMKSPVKRKVRARVLTLR